MIHELQGGKTVKEHCMSNAPRLGVTEREVITLARLFTTARSHNFGWLGIGSRDEEFVSVRSRDLNSGRTLTLKSVSTEPLPAGHLRIPGDYRQTER